MIAIAVDDEYRMLETLAEAVLVSPDITSVTKFNSCSSALEWVRKNPVDIAFMDICMSGMGGMALAGKILELWPDCKIIFCTSHPEYALEAFQIHASGYLMKPITPEAIQKEIDFILGKKSRKKLLKVQCFGNFEIFFQGIPLTFKRSRAKELLAVLIDRSGAGMTVRQISAIMWSESEDDGRHANYVHQLFTDIRKTLKNKGIEEILIQNGYSYSVDVELLDCDYYNYLKTGRPEFSGEYMTQYEWSESSCALLWLKMFDE